MTIDLQLKQLCPHRVVREWLSVESDRKTLIPVRDPSSAQIEIRCNGVIIPKAGINSAAYCTGLIPGPFEIERGVNDVLRVELDSNSATLQSIILPAGVEVPLANVIDAINSQAVGFTATNSNGKLRLTHDRAGETSVLFLRAGSAHEALGLPPSRFYRGRSVYPGWNLIKTPNTPDLLSRRIQFQGLVRASDDIWEVSYFTRRQDCRRCAGLGIENDIRYDGRGDPIFVDGIDLLAQEVEKIVFTIRGSNVFYDWYGTSITTLIGSKIVRGGSFVESQLISEIQNTLERFRSVKKEQASLQPTTPQDRFRRVEGIFVEQDDEDPTVFRVRIEVSNDSDEVAELTNTLILSNAPGGRQIVG